MWQYESKPLSLLVQLGDAQVVNVLEIAGINRVPEDPRSKNQPEETRIVLKSGQFMFVELPFSQVCAEIGKAMKDSGLA